MIVKFVVGSDGKVRDAKVVKGVTPELDAEAIRVVLAMPAWVPGKVGGKDVSSYFNLPITFSLSSGESEETKKPE